MLDMHLLGRTEGYLPLEHSQALQDDTKVMKIFLLKIFKNSHKTAKVGADHWLVREGQWANPEAVVRGKDPS